jgi:large subunit ribosomal protein L9
MQLLQLQRPLLALAKKTEEADMKVILQQSYMNLGEIGDVVDVKPGYARNFLIPEKIAVTATQGNLKVFADQSKKNEERKAKDRDGAKKLLEQLEKVSLTITKKVSEDGRLYGAVTTKEIEAAFVEKVPTLTAVRWSWAKPSR